MHEEEQRLRFHDENDTFLIGVIIEVLVDTSIFDNQCVSGFPVNPAAIMNVVPLPFRTKKTAEFI